MFHPHGGNEDESDENEASGISAIRIGTAFGGNVQVPLKEHVWFIRDEDDPRVCFFCEDDYTYELGRKEKKSDKKWHAIDGHTKIRAAALKHCRATQLKMKLRMPCTINGPVQAVITPAMTIVNRELLRGALLDTLRNGSNR